MSLYPDNKDRVLNKKFYDEFSSLIKEKSAEEWMAILTTINIPCGRVNTIREAVHSTYASLVFMSETVCILMMTLVD